MSQVESICWEEDTKYAEEVMLNRNTNNQQSFKNAWQMAEGKKKKKEIHLRDINVMNQGR